MGGGGLNDLEMLFLNAKHRLVCKHSHYLELYERHFKQFRGKNITVVEIGVFGGGSLQLWKHYFGTNAHIIGIDINPDCKKYEEEQIDVYIGSQEDRKFWKSFLEKHPKIDILIDDGGHTMNQQIVTFEETFKHISDGGIYWCEDCATSYWPSMGGGVKRRGTFIEYTKNFIDYIHAWHSKSRKLKVNEYTKNMYGLHYYDQIICIEKNSMIKRDQLFQLKTSNTIPTRLVYSLKAFAGQIILLAVSSIFPFLIRYFIIRHLGAEYLGLNGLFSSIIHTLNLAELGFDSAIMYLMYKPFADNDISRINSLLAFYRKVYIIIAAVILLAGLCCIPFLQFLIRGTYPSTIFLSKVFFIFLSNIVLNYSLFSYKNTILKAAQRTDIDNKILIVCSLLMYSSQIYIIIYLQNYYLYALMLPLSTVLGNLIRKIIVDKKFPHIRCSGKLGKKDIGILKKQITAIALSRIRNLSRYALDTVFISSFLGLTAVAFYQNYYSVLLLPLLILDAVLKSVKNSLGNFFAVEDKKNCYFLLLDFIFLSNWIISWSSICMICLYSHFITLWLGEAYLLPLSSTLLFTVLFYVFGLGNMTSMFMEVAGLWWNTRYSSIIEAGFNLILNYILLRFLGINGILVATIASILLVSLPWESKIILHNFFNVSLSEYFFKLFYFFGATVLTGFIVYYINSKIIGETIRVFILRCCLCLVMPNILLATLYIKTKEIKNIFNLLKRIIHLGV